MTKKMILLLVALMAAACGGGASTTTTTATVTTDAPVTTAEPATTAATETTAGASTTAATSTGAELVLASTDLGDIVTDPEGRTLYIFMPDAQGDPTCYDACADNWPALTAEVTAGAGLDAALLSTAARTDGGDQVIYNGWPLHYFAGDEAAGDTNGQGVGDIWWVIGADGEPITGRRYTSI